MFNKQKRQMHSRNIFCIPPDYIYLAIKFKDFRQVCKLELGGKVLLNYKNECALRTLTQTLLLEYFHLNVEFAPNSLIPTLPLRLNYLLWIEDLITGLQNEKDMVRGIDIGCGSSCIYSLLAAKKNSWHMFALESDNLNFAYAKSNIQNNDLQQLINLFFQNNKHIIFKDFFDTQTKGGETFHFCLCNPPFFDSALPQSCRNNTRNILKRTPARNYYTGNTDELSCVGGEVQFVKSIVDESLRYKQRISIYTTMLGHKSTLKKVLETIQNSGISNYCQTEFFQGNTTRWGVAWSFSEGIQLNKNKIQINEKNTI